MAPIGTVMVPGDAVDTGTHSLGRIVMIRIAG